MKRVVVKQKGMSTAIDGAAPAIALKNGFVNSIEGTTSRKTTKAIAENITLTHEANLIIGWYLWLFFA